MTNRRFDIRSPGFAFGASAAIGGMAGMAWGQASLAPLLFAVVPVLFWLISNSRAASAAGVLAYFLTASRGLPGGTAVFFGDEASVAFGAVIWLGVGVLSTLPWLLLWRPAVRSRCVVLPLIFLISACPPLGFISWTSPLLASGILFPGWGLAGMGLLILLLAAIALRKTVAISLVLVLVGLANIAGADLAPPGGWTGIDTSYGRLGGNVAAEDGRLTFKRLMDIRRSARGAAAGTLQIYPETVLGSVDDAMLPVLSDVSVSLKLRGVGALVGAELPGREAGRYTNSVVGLGVLDGFIFKQRVPVPITMWQPWANSGAYADWSGTGVAEILGHKSTILICYEQLILWPSILSSLHSPDVVIGVANDWWARNSSIPAVQSQSLRAISKTFGWKLIASVNL